MEGTKESTWRQSIKTFRKDIQNARHGFVVKPVAPTVKAPEIKKSIQPSVPPPIKIPTPPVAPKVDQPTVKTTPIEPIIKEEPTVANKASFVPETPIIIENLAKPMDNKEEVQRKRFMEDVENWAQGK